MVIVGGGAAGIATASSLLAREPGLDIAIIDPADVHYYQPGWTLVGGGVFEAQQTAHTMGATIPRACTGSKRLSRLSNLKTTPLFSMGAAWSATSS